MTRSLRDTTAANDRQNWLKTGQTRLNDAIRGDLDIEAICRVVLDFLAVYLDMKVGGLFILEGDVLRLLGSYGYQKRKNLSSEFKIGESLVGQAALERRRILLTNVPDDYVHVSSGLGECSPRNIVDVPLVAGTQLMGVLELATVGELDSQAEEFLDLVSESIGMAIASARARTKMRELLEQTQQQSEELQVQQEELKVANEEMQAQQEELKVANEELSEQTQALKASESQLQAQQEELRVTNEELEERTKALEEQRDSIGKKNGELNRARVEIERKAADLELASKYKSEFLANMSHELRTPLNSILILSQLLGENKEMNLTTKQQEFARTIRSSGSDLLELINEILDLSKVESGKMELRIEETSLREVRADIGKLFEPLAREKKLEFKVDLGAELPATIQTDAQRLKQVLKNLLSNAFKFTEKGFVKLLIGRPSGDADLSVSGLKPASAVAFSIVDSGIGIPADKQRIIFEAFQQVDGTASRKYAGTGLGLTISREMSKLLGGELQLVSEPGKGSVFTVYVPETLQSRTLQQNAVDLRVEIEEKAEEVKSLLKKSHDFRAGQPPPASPVKEELAAAAEATTASDAQDGDEKLLLIVEDDPSFAKILSGIATEKGFTCVVKASGEEAFDFIKRRKPRAIILDLQLPGIDGWAVLERLKASADTRHIPVHIMSVSDSSHEALKRGSIGFLSKPVSNEGINEALERIEAVISKAVGRLLLVEDDTNQRTSVMALIASGDVEITAVATGGEALAALKGNAFDAMILDLGLEDMSGFDLLGLISRDERLREMPVIIYTGKDLSDDEEAELRKYAETIIVKGVRSPERLLDETTLFLHRVEKDLPADKQRMLRMTRDKDAVFKSKTILIVDDDMRNVFALSSVLEYAGLSVVVGKNGKDGINKLEDNPQVSLVLMDIMMPEMDGYEAMREIRKRGKYSKLPIIALTAKAMKGDRANCIEAGANDYLSKPIDTDKLLSLLRVWLYQ
jgi:CheY-like chemotaxis protein